MLALANKLTNSTQPIYRFVNKYSIDFDGVDDVIVTDGADTVLQNTTYAFWAKSSTTVQNRGVFGHGGVGQAAFHFNYDGSRPRLFLSGANFVFWNDVPQQDNGEWNHWVVYMDYLNMNNCKLYCNGVLQTVAQTDNSGTPQTYTESLSIGGDKAAGGNYFEGQIDEFAVFDRELKQDEITRMYNTYYTQNRIANGNFAQIGNEEVSNGDFSEISSEKVSNGDFATDSDWTKGTGITISGGSANFTGIGGQYLNQNMLTSGKIYYLSFDVKVFTSGALTIFGGAANNISSLFLVNSTGTYTGYFTAGGLDNRIFFGSAFIGSIDNVSIKEVGQDWTLAENWTIDQANSKATSDGSQSSNVSLKQANSLMGLSAGKQYKVQFTISDYVSGVINPHVRGNQSGNVQGNGIKTSYIIAGSGSDGINLFAGSTFAGSVTNITVREVAQNWTLGAGTTIENGVANITVASSGSSPLGQSGSLTVGKTFKVSFTISNYSSGSIAFSNLSPTTYRNSNGTHTLIGVGAGGDFLFFSSGFVGSIDNVVVQELKSDATNLMLNAGAYQSANPLITSTNSMEFDGTDDYLNAGVLPNSFKTAFSISAWLWTDTNTGAHQIISTGQGAFSQIYQSGTGLVLQILGGSGYNNIIISGSYFSADYQGKWVYLTLVFNGATIKAYRNGIENASAVLTGTLNSITQEANIGRWRGGSEYWNGKITELGLFDRGLTSLEVASLYNQGMPTNLLVNRNDYQSGNPTVFNTKQVDFDGADDYLQLGNFNNLGTSDFSFSFWVNLDSATNVTFAGKFQDNSNRVIFYTNGANQIATQGRVGGNYAWNFTGTGTPVLLTPYLNKWTHIAFSIDRSANLLIFINGELKSTTSISSTASTNVDNTGNWFFGQSNGSFLNGQMSQSGMWNKALTANEVSSLYNHGLPVDLNTNQAAYTSSSNLVGYWRMGSGTLDAFPLIADQTNATLGSNLFVDGDFPTGTTAWNKAANWTISNGTATCSGGAGQVLYQSGIMPVGTHYKLTITVSSYTSGYLSAYGGDWDSQIIFAAGTFVRYTKSLTANVGFVGNGFIGSIENVSVQKINGNPAIMTNQTASDIENGSPYANVVQNGTFDTDSDWTKGTGVTISGGKANWTNTANNVGITQNNIITSGKNYKVVFTVFNYSSGSVRVRFPQITDRVTSNGTYTFYINATSTNLFLQGETNGDANVNFSIDKITVSEVNTGLQGYWKMGDGTNDEYPYIFDQTNSALGVDTVVNGDFSNGTTAWVGNAQTTLSVSNEQLDIQSSSASSNYGTAFSANNFILGKKYLIKLTVVSCNVPSQIRVGTSDTDNIQYSDRIWSSGDIGIGSHQIIWTSTGTYYYLAIGGRNDVTTLVIDNVSVQELADGNDNFALMTNMVEGNITNQYPLTKIRNYYRMGDGILDKFPCIQDQTSPNIAHIPTTNIVPFSENFNGTVGSFSYSKIGGSSITPNQTIAPDGTNTGTLVTGGTNALVLRANNVVELGKTYSASVFVKSSGSVSQVAIDITDNNNVQINLTNEWQRVTTTTLTNRAPVGTYNFVDIGLVGGAQAGSTFYVWGFQVEEQTQATTYLPSYGIAAVRKATTTNLITYSEDFNSYTKNQVTVASNQGISPIGTNNATKLIATGTDPFVSTDINTTNKTFTLSVYAKGVGSSIGKNVNFFLVRDNYAEAQQSSQFVLTNDWVRYKATLTLSANPTSFVKYRIDAPSVAVVGDEVLIWGSQLEEQTQAETYAKTTGLPVTIDLFTENNYGTMTNMVAGDIVLDTPNNPA